jgi:ribonuclease E
MTDESVASQAERSSEPPRESAEPAAPDNRTTRTTSSTPSTTSDAPEASGSGEGSTSDGPTGPPRRRRSRGGRGRGRGGGSGGGARPASVKTDEDGAEERTPARPRTRSAPAEGDDTTHASRPRQRRPATAQADGSSDDSDDRGETAPRPPRQRTRAPRPAASETVPEGDSDSGGDDPSDEGSGDGAGPTAARRRRRRGGRGRRRPASGLSPESAEAAEEAGLATIGPDQAQRDDALPDEGGEPAPAPSRSRRSSGGGSGARTRTRTRSGGRSASSDESSDDDDTSQDRTSGSRAVSTRRMKADPVRVRGRRVGRRDVPRPVKRRTDKRMVITEIDERDQIAVLEGRDLVEHYITRSGARSMVGNIYVGRVQNVLPGMEAAFIDIGRGRNGVLYAGEVNYDEEVEGGGKHQRIEEALKSGQRVLVQVTKDPLGGKGARLTAQVSLPGRFLVFVPNQQVFGISRRLPDAERARLRDILKPIRPEGSGVIARTAAEGATAEDLEADLKRLEREWTEVEKRAKKAKPASSVYEEPELTVRVVRDVFTEGEFEEVVTDSKVVYDKVSAYLQDVAPELVEKVRLHEGSLSVMEEYHVAEQIRKALDRKVWLPSGGYIIIDRTEAMTVIDVNTGKHTGKSNLEETVTQTNMEAAEEVARQLRLRDIGGMIIIDFIDMLLERNRGKVIRAIKSALASDRTRSQVFDISPLGLLEVTRKKVSAGLVESFSETCPTCEGRGILITHEQH